MFPPAQDETADAAEWTRRAGLTAGWGVSGLLVGAPAQRLRAAYATAIKRAKDEGDSHEKSPVAEGGAQSPIGARRTVT